MDYLMNDHPDDWGILRLQNCILNIAKYINDFCDAHGIEYCLMGGSALGAVRHKGFIPWDDDLDVFMTPDNYAKFRSSFLSEGDKGRFYLQEWGASEGRVALAKLRMNESTLIERDLEGWNIHQGVYVDIFILHNCPDNLLRRWHQYLWAKYLVAKGAANRKYNRKTGITGFLIKCLGLFPKRFLLDHALRQIYCDTDERSRYLCHFLGRATMHSGLYKRSYFEKTKKVPFESQRFSVPYYVEDYLHDRWGDYMKLPSEDEIKKFQHSWKWSDKEYFPGYNQENDYPDEKYLLA